MRSSHMPSPDPTRDPMPVISPRSQAAALRPSQHGSQRPALRPAHLRPRLGPLGRQAAASLGVAPLHSHHDPQLLSRPRQPLLLGRAGSIAICPHLHRISPVHLRYTPAPWHIRTPAPVLSRHNSLIHLSPVRVVRRRPTRRSPRPCSPSSPPSISSAPASPSPSLSTASPGPAPSPSSAAAPTARGVPTTPPRLRWCVKARPCTSSYRRHLPAISYDLP